MDEEAQDVKSTAPDVMDLPSAAGAITVGVARLEETRDEIRRLVQEEDHILKQLELAMRALRDGG